MNEIKQQIMRKLEISGYQARMVSISHLPEIQDAVTNLVKQGLLDKSLYEKWKIYFQVNLEMPEASSIITIAMPQPITRLRFCWQGVDYPVDIPPTYFSQMDDPRAIEILDQTLIPDGYKIVRARLAQKTLAVRGGLAKYGRNNITYVPGIGSFYRLISFYTDWDCQEDHWQEPKAMKACENCSLCLRNCPTGCIPEDRFLIHAENCLTRINESEEDFPDWIQPGWHNALIGCLRCQVVCPVNKPYLNRIVQGPVFSENETALILNKTPAEKLPSELRQTLDSLILDEIYPLMARNLRALIQKGKDF
jgi:epoxyqueuosine reductase